MRLVVAVSAALLAVACQSATPSMTTNGGPRPPQGPGPAGTDFGFWNRDAEGAVDVQFREFIDAHYKAGDQAKAVPMLEKDGFTCKTQTKPAEGKPVEFMDCSRFYKLYDDVHAWSVQFWPGEKEPRARYTRTHIRDRMQTYDDRKHH